jgi:hypothetical protein
MVARNVTIQLDEDLIREAKSLAAERGLSLSAMVALDIRERLRLRRRSARAREAALALMADAAASHRSAGQWSRDELHDR